MTRRNNRGLSPTQPIGAGDVGRYRDRIYDDPKHDPYQAKGKYREPAACPDCGAVYMQGRWRWGAAAAGAAKLQCPACRRIADKMPAGTLVAEGTFVGAHVDELTRLLRHVAEHEAGDHPLNRIMALDFDGDVIKVTTTDTHLPQRMAEALHSAHQGVFKIEYGHDEYGVHARWER